MAKIRPKSIVQLIFIGFFVVLFPIGLVVYGAFHSLDRLAEQNSQNLQKAVQVTRNSQQVSEIVQDMERALRQYQLLNSPKILEIFQEKLVELNSVFGNLEHSLPDNIHSGHFETFGSKVQTIQSLVIQTQPMTPEGLAEAVELIRSLQPLTEMISGSSSAYTDRIIEETDKLVDGFQESLFYKSSAVIPLTLILIALFSVLIARPFRQIHKAITKLGDGTFSDRFEVDGPRDLRDLGTRLNWLSKRLGEIDEQKKGFLRHMSHELKTPLAAMKEGGELLADEIPGPLNSRQQEVISIINQSIKYFQKVIENLLDYNLLRSHENLMLEMVDIKPLVESVINAHSLTIQRKRLKMELNGTNFKAEVDCRRLSIALDNLVSNAISFSPRNQSINVSWQRKFDQLIITVKDQGPGVKAEERKDIFSPFYQGQARKDGPIKGSGLGLSLAKECVKAHHGNIEAIKNPVGAAFRIQIPSTFAVGEA